MIRQFLRDPLIKPQAIDSSGERDSRLPVRDFGLQSRNIGIANVRRIREEQIKAAKTLAMVQNLKAIDMAEYNPLFETQAVRVPARNLERIG